MTTDTDQLNLHQLTVALRDLADYGWVDLETQEAAWQVQEAAADAMTPTTCEYRDNTDKWRVES